MPFIEYDKKFLAWWGVLLFCCKLGSRRQLDFDLRDATTQVLGNVNRLAGTQQATLPVHDTLDHFLGHVGSAPLAALRTQMIRRLLRMKVLDAARLLGRVVVAIDGTGHLHFRTAHCPQCLVRRHATHDVYLHMVEEAKLLGPGGLGLSMGTAFIENADRPSPVGRDPETWKQDCELAAFRRLVPDLRQAYPQTAVCVTSDALYACAPAVRLVEAQGWSYVFTFKAGNAQTAWTEFQAVLALCPEHVLRLTLPNGTRQAYRWATGMTAEDAHRRPYRFNALLCEETVKDTTTTFVWMTNLPVTRETVVEIAMKGGRRRWTIEAGFNVQKNSELNLEHPYSTDPELIKAYYYLLQIAHMMLQLLERGVCFSIWPSGTAKRRWHCLAVSKTSPAGSSRTCAITCFPRSRDPPSKSASIPPKHRGAGGCSGSRTRCARCALHPLEADRFEPTLHHAVSGVPNPLPDALRVGPYSSPLTRCCSR